MLWLKWERSGGGWEETEGQSAGLKVRKRALDLDHSSREQRKSSEIAWVCRQRRVRARGVRQSSQVLQRTATIKRALWARRGGEGQCSVHLARNAKNVAGLKHIYTRSRFSRSTDCKTCQIICSVRR